MRYKHGMPQVTCQYCGRSFRVRRTEPGRVYFCSSGCALASRLPPGGIEGRYPVVPALMVGLLAAFLFFNEGLFWTLALEVTREGRPETGSRFAELSAGVGVVVWLALVAALACSRAQRWTDAALLLATGALLVTGFRPPLSAGAIVAANAALGLWVVRGWSKKNLSEKPTVPV